MKFSGPQEGFKAVLWAHVERSPSHSEVCHGVSWQEWLKPQGKCD